MIDNQQIIKLRKARERDESIYCAQCDHTGRHYYVDADGQVNQRYCDCYKRHQNAVRYPVLLKRSQIPNMSWDFGFRDYRNTGTNDEQRATNDQALAQIKSDAAAITDRVKTGSNWYFQGQSGTGKTILACLLAKYGMAVGLTAAYVQFPVYAQLTFKDNNRHDEDWIDYLMWCKLLIVDNVDGYTTRSGFHESLFDQLVRPRVQNNRSVIYVATTPMNHISPKLGAANAALVQDRCTRVTLMGKDFRATKPSA
jgi:DNA replication protein DnaC